MDNKKYILSLIEENKIEEALNVLKLTIVGADELQIILTISSRYNRLQREKLLGILRFEDEMIARNQITSSLFSIVYGLEVSSNKSNPNIINTPTPREMEKNEDDSHLFNFLPPSKQKEEISTSRSDTNIRKGYEYYPEMIFVKGGSFTMGSNQQKEAQPVHKVTLSDFSLSKYPITVAQFAQFVQNTNYKTEAEQNTGSIILSINEWEYSNGVNWRCDVKGNIHQQTDYDHPVIHINWNDANAYCQWISKKTTKNYRLPTEAEWEFAARGGNQSQGFEYSGSNNLNEVAWYHENSGDIKIIGSYNYEEGYKNNCRTHAVGTKKGNELGLYDMSGNVLEWCKDFYSDYNNESKINPIIAPKGNYSRNSYCVVRGGDWHSHPLDCRSINRYCLMLWRCSFDIGFRIVQSLY